MNHDLTLFKDFRFANDQRIQFRVGFFNLFNMAYAGVRSDLTNDIDLTLETTCNVTVNGVPNGVGGTVDNVATRPAASASPTTPSPTSARSTCCAAGAWWSSR